MYIYIIIYIYIYTIYVYNIVANAISNICSAVVNFSMTAFACSLESSSAVSKELTRLMNIPIEFYKNILMLLKLDHFSALFDYFDYQARKTMSVYIITSALESDTYVTMQEEVSYQSTYGHKKL